MDSSSLTYWTRLRTTARYYLRGLVREVSEKNLFLWAQAIAFKVLVTIVPIVILGTGILTRALLSGQEAFDAVARLAYDFLPTTQSEQVVAFLRDLQQASGAVIGLGGLGLFLSAVSLFITLRIAVGNAFEQDWHRNRSLLRGYLFDVRMVLQVGLLFILTIGLSALVNSLEFTFLRSVGIDYSVVESGWRAVIQTTGVFVPFVITTIMFFQLYYLVPTPHPRKRSALTGALIAGVLWETAKQAFTYYATYVGRFDQYQGLDALGTSFGLMIAFVFWVYFSGIVLMLGAVVASLREHRHYLRTSAADGAGGEISSPPSPVPAPAAFVPPGAGAMLPTEQASPAPPDRPASEAPNDGEPPPASPRSIASSDRTPADAAPSREEPPPHEPSPHDASPHDTPPVEDTPPPRPASPSALSHASETADPDAPGREPAEQEATERETSEMDDG
jgi:membrane protein